MRDFRSADARIRVNCTHYRAAALLSASPQPAITGVPPARHQSSFLLSSNPARIISHCTVSYSLIQASFVSGVNAAPNCCSSPHINASPKAAKCNGFAPKSGVLATRVANDRLEHFALVERANNGSDHVHQFEVLSLHVAPKQALRIRREFKKPAVKLVSELSPDRPDCIERLSDELNLFRSHDGNRRSNSSVRGVASIGKAIILEGPRVGYRPTSGRMTQRLLPSSQSGYFFNQQTRFTR